MNDRKRISSLALLRTALFLLGFTIFRMVISLPRGSGLTHESGVLSGLALDFSNGLFYRPLLGQSGYGGTRYGALHIILQGSLARFGLPIIASGNLISVCSAVALAGALWLLLRQWNVSSRLSFCFAMVAFAGGAGQYAVNTIRVDLLSAALSLWGLFFVAVVVSRSSRSLSLLAIGGLFFALAILTKITDGFGIVAAVAYLLLMRRFRDAFTLTAITGALSVAALITLNAMSHGRMFENFRACANGGRAPLHIQQWCAILYEVLVRGDSSGLLLMVTALIAWLIAPIEHKRSLPGLLVVATIIMTLPLYFSPGLSVNQLIDAEAAAALFLGYSVSRFVHPERWIVAVVGLILFTIIQFALPKPLMQCFYRRTEAFRRTAAGSGPILSDHALVPVATGQTPFLLDDFTLPAIRLIQPDVQKDLYQKLDEGYFETVVLRYDPHSGDRAWALGNDFAAKLDAHYVLTRRINYWDHLWVYRRR